MEYYQFLTSVTDDVLSVVRFYDDEEDFIYDFELRDWLPFSIFRDIEEEATLTAIFEDEVLNAQLHTH
jgi:hypothetical protein